MLLLLQAEAEAADRAERARLQQLGEEVKRFNALKLMELNEKERQERYEAVSTAMSIGHALTGSFSPAQIACCTAELQHGTSTLPLSKKHEIALLPVATAHVPLHTATPPKPGCHGCRLLLGCFFVLHREQDLAILQEALAREAAEEAADVAAREVKRQAVLHYREQLAKMMAKDEADRGEQDAMVMQAQRQQQAKQDAEWAAREAARKKLMAEVDAIRQQQIAAKQQAK